MLKQIGSQAYRLALPDKYARLYPVFPVQFLEDYYWYYNNAELMAMPDLEDPQDEWDIEEVRDKWRIKSVIYYLVKWAG